MSLGVEVEALRGFLSGAVSRVSQADSRSLRTSETLEGSKGRKPKIGGRLVCTDWTSALEKLSLTKFTLSNDPLLGHVEDRCGSRSNHNIIW